MRIRSSATTLLLVLAGTMLTGCAGYDIKRVANVNDGCDGYVFYGPEPYFLKRAVFENKKGADGKTTRVHKGFTYEIVYLPNPKRRYRVDTWNFLAQAKFEFTFEDGWRLASTSAETNRAVRDRR